MDTPRHSAIYLKRLENRNKIKTSQGWSWLTVPVKSSYCALIPDVKVNYDHPWQYKHWETIRTCYRKAPFLSSILKGWNLCIKSRMESLDQIFTLPSYYASYSISAEKVFRASELNVEGKGSDLILNLCLAVSNSLPIRIRRENYLDIESLQII